MHSLFHLKTGRAVFLDDGQRAIALRTERFHGPGIEPAAVRAFADGQSGKNLSLTLLAQAILSPLYSYFVVLDAAKQFEGREPCPSPRLGGAQSVPEKKISETAYLTGVEAQLGITDGNSSSDNA